MDNYNIAYCGLFCGECGKFKNNKCPGCYANEKAKWCKIRSCCITHNYQSCTECTLILVKECEKYNNFISKVIGFVTKTDRSKCLNRIETIGYEAFAKEMACKKAMSIKK